MKRKQIILNSQEIKNKINRIAYSIIEEYHAEKSITIIGFEKNGYTIADKIKNVIKDNHSIKIDLHKIKLENKNKFSISPILEKHQLKNIFLVDDVLKSGKTIIYGIKEILKHDIGNLKTIILINRNHNQFPIGVDYVGLNLSTTLKDHIEVVMTEKENLAYLI
ncbi:MAG: phosphoribosyltransferase [Flavobacteriales bacterium]|nr:phosphoribosyltransferase [Flavobacteriales bacterium]|tara:strand:+ start:12797 stop:13288 length:492 start_codon:yes stop_codon:yes gene_type:complete